MSPILLAAQVFSVCSLDGCVAYPPLRFYPPPGSRQQYVSTAAPQPVRYVVPWEEMDQAHAREWIIDQGERFCAKYGRDPICHPAR